MKLTDKYKDRFEEFVTHKEGGFQYINISNYLHLLSEIEKDVEAEYNRLKNCMDDMDESFLVTEARYHRIIERLKAEKEG